MRNRETELLKFVQTSGVVRSREVITQGFHSQDLTRLVSAHRLQRLERGLYALPHHPMTEWHELAEISKLSPQSVISLISALAFHGIGTQLPQKTWITLPSGAKSPRFQNLRVSRFAEPFYSAGIEEHAIEGVSVKVYSAAKTVADCFRMRSKVGYDVAVEALKEGWRDGKFALDDLANYARIDRVASVMKPYLEAIVS